MDVPEKKDERERLDKRLVLSGLAKSRARAKALIEKGAVFVDGSALVDPSAIVPTTAIITLSDKDFPWVSRGALKLIAALDAWAISVTGRTCLDIGSSTGGFTEALLECGARQVYALDVGHDQLDVSLRHDPRVVVMEGTHILGDDLSFPCIIDLIVADVSFLSLVKVLPVIGRILTKGGEVVLLVKPQFEVGKEKVGKGVVRDVAARRAALDRVSSAARAEGFVVEGTMDSPITGGSGNHEFLLYARKK